MSTSDKSPAAPPSPLSKGRWPWTARSVLVLHTNETITLPPETEYALTERPYSETGTFRPAARLWPHHGHAGNLPPHVENEVWVQRPEGQYVVRILG